ncbi:hypothetical protein M2284_005325 [Rhodococcus sp. LBL1]|nr:hypothetical protein [Rhodococcus sp. LBL1]MDH6683021.1 hypothetical protein [Rhodococcus sp. LBL2]
MLPAGGWSPPGTGRRRTGTATSRPTPRARVQVGRHRSGALAEFLDADAGGDLMAHYGGVHPKVGARLCKSMGFEVDGSEADFRAAGRNIHFVRLRPVHG